MIVKTKDVYNKIYLYCTMIIAIISTIIGVHLSFNSLAENVDGLILIGIAILLINSIKSDTEGVSDE